MPEAPAIGDAVLEVIFADNSRRTAYIAESPFLIGRGETGNHLRLPDLRVSRHSASVVWRHGAYTLEDAGQQGGLFVNGKKITSHVLRDGDVITFGPADSCEVIFRTASPEPLAPNLSVTTSSALGSVLGSGASVAGLNKLNLLLEATMLLRSQLPLDSVLGTMLDHAIAVTQADRGLLLVPDSSGELRGRLARRSGGLPLQPESFVPSQTALRLALERKSGTITEDLARAEGELQEARSIVAQQLRAVVVIPLYAMAISHGGSAAAAEASAPIGEGGDFLGVVYLDSRRPAAFSKLDRQILNALAVEAASILDNARLVERELERQLLAQELRMAREIQQAMLPAGLGDCPGLAATGINLPSLTASGDYFDVFHAGAGRTAFLIADVSGKGLGAALLTTMLQGALLGVTAGANASGIFGNVNRFLCRHSEVNRYATVFFGIVDGRSGELEFFNAGHPSPVLLRGGQASQPFTEGSVPVGLLPDAEFPAARAQLERGDTLVLFSDGVTEAMNAEEEMFGAARLCEAVSAQPDAPLEKLQESVLASLKEHTRSAPQRDDITLLLVRYVGNGFE